MAEWCRLCSRVSVRNQQGCIKTMCRFKDTTLGIKKLDFNEKRGMMAVYLTESESILCSDLFMHLASNTSRERIRQMADTLLNVDFPSYIHDSQIGSVVVQWDDDSNEELGCDFIPSAWNIDRGRLSIKIDELLSSGWLARVKNGFIETLNTALEQ